MNIPQVKPGDKIKAADWNRLRSAVFGKTPGVANSDPISIIPLDWQGRDKGMVWFKNDTEATIPPFSVVVLESPSIAPTSGHFAGQAFQAAGHLTGQGWATAFASGQPDPAWSECLWGITHDYARPGKYAPVQFDGMVIMPVTVSDESHRFAKPVNGNSATLASTPDSSWPMIVWKPSGTGEKLCLIRLGSGGGGGGLRRVEIKTNQADNAAYTVAYLLNASGTATTTEINLYHLPTKGNVAFSSMALSTGAASLADGDKVLAGQTDAGEWYLVNPIFMAYCEAAE